MDSDDDDTDNPILGKADDEEDKDIDKSLSPDDIRRQGELEEGVRKIRVGAGSTLLSISQTLTMFTAQAPALCRPIYGQR